MSVVVVVVGCSRIYIGDEQQSNGSSEVTMSVKGTRYINIAVPIIYNIIHGERNNERTREKIEGMEKVNENDERMKGYVV